MKKFRIIMIVPIISLFVFSCGEKKQGDEETQMIQAAEKVIISTPDQAIVALKNGNNRFVTNQLINTDYKEQIEASKEKQQPHSVILSCMDSRVPPEIIFDQGIGNIFVARNAGNIEDENILGSIEYAVKFAGSKLIVVMGHSRCGAVSGAIQNVDAGNLTQLVNQIKVAIPPKSDGSSIVEETAKNSVSQTIQDILNRSTIIKELVETNKIKIVGAFYDIETGKVTFME